MPKKLSNTEDWPTLVQERLAIWGKSIHAQRLQQRITGADLCARIGISRATLRRLEQGSPDASAGAYLTALLALGLGDQAAPALPSALWQGEQSQRFRLSRQEKGSDDADKARWVPLNEFAQMRSVMFEDHFDIAYHFLGKL